MPIVEDSSLIPNPFHVIQEDQRNYESFTKMRTNARTNKIHLKKEVLREVKNIQKPKRSKQKQKYSLSTFKGENQPVKVDLTWNQSSNEKQSYEDLQECQELMEQGHQQAVSQNKMNYLLNFDDSDDEQEIKSEREKEQQIQNQIHSNPNFHDNYKANKNLLLNFDSASEEESQQQLSPTLQAQVIPARKSILIEFDQSDDDDLQLSSTKPSESTEIVKIAYLSTLMNMYAQNYINFPIPRNYIFQCVIKREKNGEDGIRYLVYDAFTLKNFLTVRKDSEGYIVVSRYDCSSKKNIHDSCQKEKVIGKIISNFFGTQFNLYSCLFPFSKTKSDYKINPLSNAKQLTIEYQVNLFGMKGPRKMKIYIPKEEEIITEERSLSQIYVEQLKELQESQQKQRQESQVQKLPNHKSKIRIDKYCNKSPKWNNDINAYVLNFRGRATISSVKNFLIAKEESKEDDPVYVLFGKAGKQLFNLDIKYPFSILQGLSMAVSSFDKKLMCQ